MLALAPVWRALAALVFAGASFPLCGVMVLRLNLLPLRYTLMHGLLLGGTIALALGLPPLPLYIAACLITVAAVFAVGRGGRVNLGISSSFVMVLSVAIAAVIAQAADVPAKDTLELLWGSPFTVRPLELAAFGLLALAIVLYSALNFRRMSLLFFDRDVALADGMDVRFHETVMVLLVAFTVALSMRFVGALLIDALLVLPVVVAMKRARSAKDLFIRSSLTGFASALLGFFLSLLLDMPPSSMIALSSAVMYAATPKTVKKKTKEITK